MSTRSRRLVARLVALLAILLSVDAMAQNEVVVTTLVKPPYSPYLSDYIGFDNKVVVTLFNTSNTPQSIRLAGQVKGSTGVTITIPASFIPAAPIVLAPKQQKLLMGAQLKEYLDPDILQFSGISKQTVVQGNGLPEGDYSFCLRALDYGTGQPRSQGAPAGCANFAIAQIEPPSIIAPACNATIPAKNPQSVLFTWTAPAGAPAAKVEYLLKIAEIYPQNGSAAQAMAAATNPPFFEKVVSGTSFFYGGSAPKLEPGKRYAVRVTARNKGQAKDLNFRNNGHSVVCSFTYGAADMADEEPADSSGGNNIDEEYADPCTALNCAPKDKPSQTPGNKSYQPGDEVQIGYFTLKLVSLTSGAAGNLSGEGTIDAPVFRTQLRATFQGLKVNPQNRVYAGTATGAYDPGAQVDQALRSFVGGVENIAAEKVKQASDIVRANKKYIESFANVDAQGLPFAFNKVIDSKLNLVTIAAVEFAPDGARFNAFLEMPVPEANNKVLAFGQKNICFHPTGLSVGGLQKLTMLGNDYTLPWGEKITLTLKKAQGNAEGTYVRWDCKGFKDMQLDGVMTFKGTMLEKTEGNGEVKGTFKLNAGTWGDLLGEITVDPFTIRGMKGLKLTFNKVVLDFSDTRNAPEMAFPAGYNGGTGKDWRGVYFKTMTATLPPYLKKNGKAVTITLSNALIGKMGFTGGASVQPVFGVNDGNLGGWGFSMEKFELAFLNNTLTKGAFNGKLKLPISSTQIGYSCLLANSDTGMTTMFAVNPIGDVDVDMWGAKLTITNGSNITVTSAGNDVTVRASMSGSLTIDKKFEDMKGVHVKIPDARFENLVVQNRKPYLSATLFTFASPQKSFAGFPVSIDSMGIKFNADGTKAGLRLAIHVGLDGNAQSAISGGTAFTLWGKMTEQNGTQSWSIAPPTLEQISIKASVAACDMEGTIDLYKGDQVFGDGFRGAIMVNFRPIIKLSTVVQFGSTKYQSSDLYRYWYVDAMATMGSAIPVMPGFGIYGFGGGAYYHMKPAAKPPAAAALTGKSGADGFAQDKAGQTSTGTSYVPSPTTKFGFKATIVMGTMPSKNAFNGDVSIEAAFYEGGGLEFIALSGKGYFMQVPNPKARPSDATALVTAAVDFRYATEDKAFDGLVAINLNLKAGSTEILTGGGDASMHFSPDKWFIKLGTPKKPIKMTVLDFLDIDSYLMLGKNSLPGMPALPKKPINFAAHLPTFNNANPRKAPLENGSGFAFGQQVSVETGKLKFLIFYAQIAIAFGYDVSILQLDQQCEYASGGTMGVGGWYAKGQVYAGVEAEVGLDINLWFLKTQIELFQVGVVAALEAGLPNPTYLKGAVHGEYSALNGLLSGECSFKFKYGNKCDESQGDAFGGLKVIAEIKPGGNDASVFSYPEAAYNLPIGKQISVSIVNDNDKVVVHRFRFGVKDFTVRNAKTKEQVAGSSELVSNGMSTLFTPADMFAEKTEYNTEVRIYGDKLVDGVWKRIMKVNNPNVEHYETDDQSFTTGDAPETFTNSNIIATSPARMQRYYHWQDGVKPYIGFNVFPSSIQNSTPDDPAYKYRYIARLQEIGGGSAVLGESPLEWDANNRRVSFAMPAGVKAKTLYVVQIVRQKVLKAGKEGSSGGVTTVGVDKAIGGAQTIKVKESRLKAIRLGDNEFLVYQLAFKTSEFSQSSAKVADYLKGTKTISTGSGDYASTVWVQLTGREPLDWYDTHQGSYKTGPVTKYTPPLMRVEPDDYINSNAGSSNRFWFVAHEYYGDFVKDPWINGELQMWRSSQNPDVWIPNPRTRRAYPPADAYAPGSRLTNGSSIADSVFPKWATWIGYQGNGDHSRLTDEEINAMYQKGINTGNFSMGGPGTGGNNSGGGKTLTADNRIVIRNDAGTVVAKDRKAVYEELLSHYGSNYAMKPMFWTFMKYTMPKHFDGPKAGEVNTDYEPLNMRPGSKFNVSIHTATTPSYGAEIDVEIPK